MMIRKFPEITQEILNLMRGFARLRWSNQSCPELKPSECELLGILFISTMDKSIPSLSASDLSNELQITPAGVTHQVNSLEKAGYIQRMRDPKDRRVVLIGLTEKGKNYSEKLVFKAFDRFDGLVKHLGEEDSRDFIRIMSSALDYFVENPPAPKQ